ncbi:putative endonuclease 4 [Styela clava]
MMRLRSQNARISKKTGSKRKQKSVKATTSKSQKLNDKITGDFSQNKLFDNSISTLYIGAQTSISGGLWKAAKEASQIGAKAFALFLRNQRQWKIKPLDANEVERFKLACIEYGYSPEHIIPHGSYLMNCGSPSDEIRQKSHDLLVEELKRTEELDLLFFNFHPGSTLGKISVQTCISYIADAINKAHKCTKYSVILLENMCCQGNTIGGNLKELSDIISLVNDKSRIGVCIDTCHAHATGYDLSKQEGYNNLMNDLENIIGIRYVKALHLNDSKGLCGCHSDRHENIGRGTIGLDGFRRIINDSRFANVPMIIETPMTLSDAEEIKLLYSLKI